MGGVLEHPGKLSKDSYERIKASFDEAHSGENAHKTALLEEGMKFSRISLSANDSQFLETRKYQRSEIAAIFRVPPHMIGDLEKATFSNIEQQSLEFVNYSLMPWLVRIEKAIKRDLMTPAERKTMTAKFNVSGLLRGDASARSALYHNGILDGWMTRNEARAAESELGIVLGPIDGLDLPLIPLNMEDGTILGYPVVEAEDIAAKGANSLSLAFGNFRQGYLIVDRIGTRVVRDPFSNKPYIGFYTTKRVGGALINSEAIKVLKFATA